MKIRIHKETYEQLCQYAYENNFYGAIQDYLEECGITIKIHRVCRDPFERYWDINSFLVINSGEDCLYQLDDGDCLAHKTTYTYVELFITDCGYYEEKVREIQDT